MKKVALAEIKDQLSKFLRDAGKEEILITRHGKAAGILIGFESEDDWFDYKLENDPRFLGRVERARQSLRAGRGVRIEDLSSSGKVRPNQAPQRTGSSRPDRSGGKRQASKGAHRRK